MQPGGMSGGVAQVPQLAALRADPYRAEAVDLSRLDLPDPQPP